MKWTILCLVPLSLIHASPAPAQSDSSGFSFFPERLAFKPFLANHEEARIGLQQDLGSSMLTIGVGTSVDVIEHAAGNATLRWGPDFYVFALSSEIRGVLFKIAAADGFFGMHLTYTSGPHWGLRFRITHQSAHLVDGSYNGDSHAWSGGREPFNFTRNYGEADASFETTPGKFILRLYSGVSYSIWNRPREYKPFSSLYGVEIRLVTVPVLYLACNITLSGVPEYVGSNSIESGVRLGEWTGRGARIYLSYYSGLDTFGALYNLRREYFGAGFSFDMW